MKTIFKDWFEAAYALFFFRPYTAFSRWVEIILGITAWLVLLVIVLSLSSCSISRQYKDSDPFRDSDTVFQARMGALWEQTDSGFVKIDTVK